MTIIYFVLRLGQFLHSISLFSTLIRMFAKAWLLSFSSLEKASAWDILLLWWCWIVKLYCCNLQSHLAFCPIDKLAVFIISRTMWLVMIVKDFTLKYCLNFSTPHIMVRHFCSVIGYFFSCSLKALLTQAISFSLLSSSFWYRIALTPPPEASIYKIKGLSKSECTTTGTVVIFLLISSKAFCLWSVHSNDIRIPLFF